MEKPVKRTFLSKAYLRELEPGTFGLFRNLEVEEVDPKTGQPVREKVGRPIGPIGLLREAAKGEEAQVVLRTYHPTQNRPIELVKVQ